MPLSPKTRERAENFCIYAGIDLEQFEDAGIAEALKTFDAFVKDLPPQFLEPKRFAKVLAYNVEFLYSLIESVGMALVSDNNNLNDQVKECHRMMDSQREQTLIDLSKLSKSIKTSKFMVSGTDAASFAENEEEDLPYWKVTLELPNGEKVTRVLDHIEASQYFNHVTVVHEDPHPEYDGDDALDMPQDDIDMIDDVGQGDWDEDDDTM